MVKKELKFNPEDCVKIINSNKEGKIIECYPAVIISSSDNYGQNMYEIQHKNGNFLYLENQLERNSKLLRWLKKR
jgi:hypothetical protein